MKILDVVLPLLAFACFAYLTWIELDTLWNAGDYMIGFLFIFTLPAAGFALLIWLVVAAVRKSWAITAIAILGCAAAVAPLFFAAQITRASWVSGISQYDSVNQAAITGLDLTDFDYTSGVQFYSMDLKPAPDFKWYCDQHIAAPEGVFSAFALDSLPHVYVNKIRHGAKGLAWIEDESKIPTDGEFKYVHSGVSNWYIWSF